jgi:putative ABC transport system permease protein
MESLLLDIRYALRTLIKNRGFTAIAVLILAVGTGANTAIFSVVNGVLLRPLPYPDEHRLVNVWQTHDEWLDSEVALLRYFAERMPASYPVFHFWAEQNSVFEAMAAFTGNRYALSQPQGSEVIEATMFTGRLFQVLGVQPIVGRGFLPEEDRVGAERVVVLSYGFWQRQFAGAHEAVGQTISLDGRPYTVIGVMPREFYFPDRSKELYTLLHDDDRKPEWNSQSLTTVARLGSGVTLEDAQAGLKIVQQRANEANPEPEEYSVRLVPLLEELVGDTRPTLLILLAAGGLVLLVVTANIANLFLVRATGRRREIAMRAALGAGLGSLTRQLLVEGFLLALAGGMAGLALASWLLQPLRLLIPPGVPRVEDIGIDLNVIGFILMISVLLGWFLGLVPAYQASRLSLSEILRDSATGSVGGKGRSRTRSILVIAEVALAVILLVGATLLMTSYVKLQAVERGFDTQNLLTLRVTPAEYAFPERQQVLSFQRRLLESVAALPGVASVGLTSSLPFSGGTSVGTFTMVDDPSPEGVELRSLRQIVSTNYLRSMGIPLLRGRAFTRQDDEDAPLVVIINKAMADRFWPGQDPIGRQIREGSGNDGDLETIIGIVGNVKHKSLDERIEPKRYRPLGQGSTRYSALAVRISSDPLELIPVVRRTIWDIDDRVTLRNVYSMKQLVGRSAAEPRFRTLTLTLLAGIAVLLSVVGVYGVISYLVAQGVREIGVRMALGARPLDVVRHVAGFGLALSALGVGIGTTASLAGTRVIESYLFEVSATDPMTFAAVAVLIVAVAAIASGIPAWRATRIDPVVVLKGE